jgi:tripartite-type tricarboxylate transporter receptor subunit TctC
MSNFKEFMDEVKESPDKALPATNTTLPKIQLAITETINGLLSPSKVPSDEQQKFSEEVASLVQDEAFLSEFSDQIGEPSEDETEDEFVKRGSDTLRQILYKKFGIED